MSIIKSEKQWKTENHIESKMEASLKMLKQMMALASVTSCISGGLLTERRSSGRNGDEGGNAYNVS